MNAPAPPPKAPAAAVVWFASIAAACAHGRGFAEGDGASPAAEGMALTMLGLVLFVISGVAGLVFYLRYKAAHPSPDQSLLDTLPAAEGNDPGVVESSVERESPGPEAWNKAPDWWKRESS
jgi:hypothetical protein